MSRMLAIYNDAGEVINIVLGKPEDFPGAVDVTDFPEKPKIVRTDVVEAAPVNYTVSTRNFLRRFTKEELVAIEMASLDKATASVATRQASAEIRVLKMKLFADPYVTLSDAEVVNGVASLEIAGLLASGRTSEIIQGH